MIFLEKHNNKQPFFVLKIDERTISTIHKIFKLKKKLDEKFTKLEMLENQV